MIPIEYERCLIAANQLIVEHNGTWYVYDINGKLEHTLEISSEESSYGDGIRLDKQRWDEGYEYVVYWNITNVETGELLWTSTCPSVSEWSYRIGFYEDTLVEAYVSSPDKVTVVTKDGVVTKTIPYVLDYDFYSHYSEYTIRKIGNWIYCLDCLIDFENEIVYPVPERFESSFDNPYEIFNMDAGRNGYYGLTTDDEWYTICYKDQVLTEEQYNWLIFEEDYIIAGDYSLGESYVLDYNGNKLATYVDIASGYDGEKFLVYDGEGCFFIDSELERISEYIYKGQVDSVANGAIVIDGYYKLAP